jgi:hypothetical protein
MKLFGPSIVIKANHILWAQEDIENFSRTHDRLEEIFERRRIPGKGKLSIPYGWSGIVLHFVTMAIEQDMHITFATIEEQNDTLYVDYYCSNIMDENEVEDLLYSARNRIAALTHTRINRALKMKVVDDEI